MRIAIFGRHEPAPAPEAPVTGAEARKLILAGRAPDNLHVRGLLDLSNSPDLVRLPPRLRVGSLDLSNCPALKALPTGLRLQSLKLNNCRALRALPPGLHCDALELRGSALRTLPPDLRVTYKLDLSGSVDLQALPVGLSVGTLILRDCHNLETLPEDLDVFFLDISGCVALREWPQQASIRFGHLRAQGCTELRSLPPWLDNVSQLDLRDCTSIRELPEGLTVNAWVDLANTGITSLPPALKNLPLRWRGVPIDERIAFDPAAITVREVLDEPNVERRRVLLERMGYEAFLSHADAQVIHHDEDLGGERRLLRVRQPNDEDLVCLAVYCPSTGRQYIIRVPPSMRTCRQAAAWIAGFDNVDDYQPIAET
ncbi:MAG TPA: hypothetical protein VLA19_05095 [Herpetosiphonaceae bacterium]|nr:hypothetical protein [Herpetosiphonaceae bacterium]